MNYKRDLLEYEKVKIESNIKNIQRIDEYKKKIEKEIENFQEELNWDGMWSVDDAIDRLEAGWYFNVMEMDNYITGWVWFNPIENLLCNLYVNKEFRKKGHGKQLIYSIMNLTKDDNIDTIYAEVDWWNDSGNLAFSRTGLRTVERREWKKYETN